MHGTFMLCSKFIDAHHIWFKEEAQMSRVPQGLLILDNSELMFSLSLRETDKVSKLASRNAQRLIHQIMNLVLR